MGEERPAQDGLNRLWGRHKAHPLKPRQAALIESLLPRLAVPLPTDENAIDPRAIGWARVPVRVHLEIGFGGGEHLAALAARLRDDAFIGAEHFLNGIGKLLVAVEGGGLDNVRILPGDVRPLLARLEARSLSCVYILFPDPWPKKRHRKRRIVQTETLQAIARVLEDEGLLRIASDIPDYIAWTLSLMARQQDLEWTAERAADWAVRPADWPETRYEKKALAAGRRPAYLTFRRRPRAP